MVALLSSSSIESQKDFGNVYSYFTHQITFGLAVGLFAAVVTYSINYTKWKTLALPLFILCVFLLILVFIPEVSIKTGGARRWINVLGVSLQPSEFLKLGFIIYLAAFFSGRKNVIGKWSQGFIPFLLISGLVGILIILQPDVGTLGVIMMTSALMYFVAGANLFQIGALIPVGLGLLAILIKLAPYRMQRLTSFLNPSEDPQGISYQINQALLAVGSGGILGVGVGKSLQKYHFLPEPMKDSIFAIWAEELGFVGAVLLICLFLFFAFRGLKVARNADDRFGKLVACGIVFWITTQAFVNIGSMLGLMPLTGIPLPFISYGGSAMVTTLAGMGILVNISKH